MAAARLPRFPEFGLLSVMKLLQLFPALAPAAGSKLLWELLLAQGKGLYNTYTCIQEISIVFV